MQGKTFICQSFFFPSHKPFMEGESGWRQGIYVIESWVLNPNVLSSVNTRAGFCLHPARTVNVVRCIYSTQQDVELYRKGVLRIGCITIISFFSKKGRLVWQEKKSWIGQWVMSESIVRRPSRDWLVFHLTVWESGATFPDQSPKKLNQKQNLN